jgi:hypothetical protein
MEKLTVKGVLLVDGVEIGDVDTIVSMTRKAEINKQLDETIKSRINRKAPPPPPTRLFVNHKQR